MLFAIDTSTLIVLYKLKWLGLCSYGGNEFIWPPSVTQELKRQKGKNKAILDLLTSGIAGENEVVRQLQIGEISQTDVEVISLAAERQATVISEDVLLRKKAAKLGYSANSLASFCVLLYQSGLFSKAECLDRLKTLNENTFLSTADYRQFLQGLGS
jgi:predicted nucleic acid-binding protein